MQFRTVEISCFSRAGLNIRGGGSHTNIRRGPFLILVARIFSKGASLGVHFSSPKS